MERMIAYDTYDVGTSYTIQKRKQFGESWWITRIWRCLTDLAGQRGDFAWPTWEILNHPTSQCKELFDIVCFGSWEK